MEAEKSKFNDRADTVAIFLSGLCLIHCILTPLILAGIPFVSGAVLETWTHVGFLAVLLAAGGWAIWRGYRLHHERSVLLYAAAGFGLLTLGIASRFILGGHYEMFEIPVTSTGSLILIWTHIKNLKFCRCVCCDSEAKS